MSPILESPDAAASSEEEGGTGTSAASQRLAASTEGALICADAADESEVGTTALQRAAAESAVKPIDELAAEQLAALFAVDSPAPAVALPPLQRLLALCGQVCQRTRLHLTTTP